MLMDSLQHDGLYCSLSQGMMGEISEKLARRYSVNREDQDRYALASHRKAIRAQESGIFSKEIISMELLQIDEGPRKDTSLKQLSSLRPAFTPNGTITAGNSSTVNDGAAISLLASEKLVKKYGLHPQVRIIDAVFIGLQPDLMGMGAFYAVEKLLHKNSLETKNVDLFEINEAFAVQAISVIKKLEIDESKVNIYGGAIAIGHPLGMSGARIIGSLINALKQTNSRLGVASLCVGGGQGAAILIENI
jgi:acetyl-CoA acetyltransferase family protein